MDIVKALQHFLGAVVDAAGTHGAGSDRSAIFQQKQVGRALSIGLQPS
jgi:hypothetical protein